MRETIIKNEAGKELKINIRPLTRKEIKGLKEYGYSYVGVVKPTVDNAGDLYDKALELVLTKKELEFLDGCTLVAMNNVWVELFKETYGDPAESKNSGNTTDGTSTKSE